VTLGYKLVRSPHSDPSAVYSLLSPTPHIRLSVFSNTCALFHFPYHTYPTSFPQFAHSSAKNRGCTPHVVYPEQKRRVHPESERRANPPKLQRRRAISFISPTYENHPRISFVSHTYAKAGGYTPTQKCRRADIRDFSPDISHFLALSAARRVDGHGFCYSMERPAFLRHRSQRSANSHRKAFLP
jgi:hypothetical protein